MLFAYVKNNFSFTYPQKKKKTHRETCQRQKPFDETKRGRTLIKDGFPSPKGYSMKEFAKLSNRVR